MAKRGGWDVVVGWVRSALPMVRDREQTVADRALEGVATLVLAPLADASAAGKVLPDMTRALMSLMGDDSRAHLQYACRTLGRKKPSGLPSGLTKRLMARLAAVMGGGAAAGGQDGDVMWWVLEEVAPQQASGVDHALLLAAYRHGVAAHAGAGAQLRPAPQVCVYSGGPLRGAGEHAQRDSLPP
jgi:hypothetical protein